MNLTKAQKLLAAGRFADAETALQTGETSRFDPRRSIVLARIHAEAGEMDRALEELAVALQQAPGHAPTHLYRGIFSCDIGNADQARICFEKVLELQPQNDLAWSYLALALCMGGADAAGLKIFRERGFNDNRWFLVRLAEWMETEWLENSRFFAPQAIEKPFEETGDIGGRTGRERRAMKHFRAKRYREMLDELEPLALGPRLDEETAFACALACEMIGDNTRALAHINRLPEGVDLPDALLAARGRNQMRLGLWEEAAEDLGRVLIIGPEDYGTNYCLGVLCLSHRERRRARRLLFRAFSDYIVDTYEYQFWQMTQALLAGDKSLPD
ncbi:MAG: tetratricopeptide repeat protein [Candidatus Sumerlaeaceae bacterium]|nr:tetratricopeptide repeat protein [Candidatus Sumerlaeaceae bacterium]